VSNEARVQSSLSVQKRDAAGVVSLIDYQGRPASFAADVGGNSGPYGGVFLVPVTGLNLTVVAALVAGGMQPGLYRIMNQDAANLVVYGQLYAGEFVPWGELLPGETYVGRLYRFFGSDFSTVGTGTAGQPGSQIHLQSTGGTCAVLFELFPK
jgi:hypothetical protein